VIILIVLIVWLALLFLTFRPPGTPAVSRLLFFLCLLVATGALAFGFAVKVLKWNPNPVKVQIAHWLMEDKFIDLAQVAPGVYDLEYINLIDTDATGKKDAESPNEPTGQEWLVFYQYDVVDPEAETVQGPFGAAIYGLINCRPPSILSYELASIAGGPLAEDAAAVVVENVVSYKDPESPGDDGAPLDLPEVVIAGSSRGVVTDLNIFRRMGVQLNCVEQRSWRITHPGEAFPNPIRYQNVGSFHATYSISREEGVITTLDRNGMERSQIATQRIYEPENGSYFVAGTQTLLPPKETGLVFSPGQPKTGTQVHYPEKAVLAFYLALGNTDGEQAEAKKFLSEWAKLNYRIESDSFGVALDRRKLDKVLVWEIGYVPDVQAEQLHQSRRVQVTVVGVDSDGNVDSGRLCQVTWHVVGVPNDQALPYGCEWRLESYESACQP